MNRFDLFRLVLAGLLLAAGTWLLAGQPGSTTPIVFGFVAFAANLARYRRRRRQHLG